MKQEHKAILQGCIEKLGVILGDADSEGTVCWSVKGIIADLYRIHNDLSAKINPHTFS